MTRYGILPLRELLKGPGSMSEFAMTRRWVAHFVLLAGSIMLVTFGGSAAGAEPRAVVELFTSQGCSSCPPADEVLGELARDPSLIVMSLPIDYWDYLGWKDTLALHGHSNRQRAYAGKRGDREVYTPQAVVNGGIQVLGSDKAAIEQAVSQSRKNAAALALPVKMSVSGDKLTVDVPPAKDANASGEIWLCPVTKSIPVAIGRGENSGHTITYTNVVRRWTKLGDWSGKAETFSVSLADLKAQPDVDAVVVVVQSGVASAPGTMLGASMIALP